MYCPLILFLLLHSANAFSEQGTWSTDDTEASQADASLSGFEIKKQVRQEKKEAREKQEFVPNDDPIPITIKKGKLKKVDEDE